MERLDATVHHLRKAGDLGDADHGETGLLQDTRGSASGNELDTAAGERPGEVDQTGFVGDAQQGSRHGSNGLTGCLG